MSKIYRITATLVLAIALILLTACAPTKQVNAVVDSFMGYWKDGNADKMAELMTSEVDFGIFFETSTPKSDSRSVSAEAMADFLAIELDVDFTYIISNTETYGTYATTTVLITNANDPEDTIEAIIHLVKVEKTWKICLVAIPLG